MRITQHEENRVEGTDGRREREGRKEREAKVRQCGRERDKGEDKKEGHSGLRSSFSIPLRLTSALFLEFVNSGLEEMNMEPR